MTLLTYHIGISKAKRGGAPVAAVVTGTQKDGPRPANGTTTGQGLLLGKDPEKRIKVLQKKLKQIGEIRMKIAAGQKVELTQMQKIEAEDDIIKELKELTLGNEL
jgi:hypothetical protein